MSNENQRYNNSFPNGQMDPFRRNMNNPNINNSNMNNSFGNKPNMNNSQPNKGRRPADFNRWGLPPRLYNKPQNNSNINNSSNKNNDESTFNENNPKMEARPSGQGSPQNRNISQQKDFYQQERFNDNQSNFYKNNRSQNYNGQDIQFGNPYNRRSDYGNMNTSYRDDNYFSNDYDRYRDDRDDHPSDYDRRRSGRDDHHRNNYPNGSDRHRSDRNDYPNDYDYYHQPNFDDRDRFNNYDRNDRFHYSNGHDRDMNRYNDRFDRSSHRDRDDNFHSTRRYQSSSTTSSTNSASISSSSSTNIQRTNSLPKAKLNAPDITPNSPQISISPQSFLPDSDNDIGSSDEDLVSPANKDDKNRKNSSTVDSSIMLSRREVVDQPNNIAELPASIKKLTQAEKPSLFTSDPTPNKDFAFSKPKKKVSLISPSNSSTHSLFNDIESKPKSQVEGLTPISKKPAINYTQQFGDGISPFPGIKKGKDKFFDSFEAIENVDDWIELKLYANTNLNNQNKNEDSDKLNQNLDDLDFIEFIHEFNFDDDVLRRRDWQKNPDPLVKRISSKEMDFNKNNEPIEAFIVKDKNDPFYYDVNLFTLEPVMTEEEKLSKLLTKYNLPDIHQYIGDQINKIEEDKKKSISNLSKLKK